MNNLNILIFGIMIFNLFGCQESKEDKAFKIFNEGVGLSMEAGKLMEEGNEEKGEEKYEKAIEKFKETLRVDPNHKGAASSIGFSYYEIRNYDEARNWFSKAINAQPGFAVNFQFLGLSQINKGDIEKGEKNIEKAFELDSSNEMKSSTVENLVYIGNLAYSYGEAYEKEGDMEKGNDFRKFGVRVLMSALKYSNDDVEIAKMIENYALEMNDEILLNWIKEKMKN